METNVIWGWQKIIIINNTIKINFNDASHKEFGFFKFYINFSIL